MNRIITAFSILVFLSVFWAAYSIAAEPDVIIHYPVDKSSLEFELVNASIELKGEFPDALRIVLNGREVKKIVPDLKYECFSLALALGINEIHLIAEKEGKIIYDSAVHVFRRSDLVSEYSKEPPGYVKTDFHMRDNTACAECHTLVPREHDRKPVSPTSFIAKSFDKKTVLSTTSTCYSCHKNIATHAYVHGPVAVWSCLSCHDSEASPMYATKKPDSEVCFSCHKEQQNDWESKKYTHGPVTIGKCAICHSPHSADSPFNLYKDTWHLCVNCHAEKASGKHVLGDAFSTEGHPTRGKPDPVRPGKELNCASCHNPHASNFPHLWAFEVESIFELCRKCHYDK